MRCTGRCTRSPLSADCRRTCARLRSGQGSAAALRRAGIADVIAPTKRFDSETLARSARDAGARRPPCRHLPRRRRTRSARRHARRARRHCRVCGVLPSRETRRRLRHRSSSSGRATNCRESSSRAAKGCATCSRWSDSAGARGSRRRRFSCRTRASPRPHARSVACRVLLTGPNDDGIVAGMIDWWSSGAAVRKPD